MTIKLIVDFLLFMPTLGFAQTNIPPKVESGGAHSTSNSEKVGSSNSWKQYCANAQCTNVSAKKPVSAAPNPATQEGIANPSNGEIGKKHLDAS